MDLFELVAKLTLDSSEYDSGLDDSQEKASSFGGKLTNTLSAAGKVGGLALGAVTAAGTAAVGAFISGTKSVAEYGDNIDKMSQKMGISREAYQEWDAIMQHSGTSIDGMARGMTTLSMAVEKGDDTFEQLGLSLDDLKNMKQEEIFAATITALQNMESGTERTVLAQKLLGGSARQLGALLNTSAEDTEAMRQRVHELGGVMSDEAVKSAAAFQDSLQDMQTSIQGLGRNILSDFLPSVTSVMDGLAMLFTGDASGAALITRGISDMIVKIGDAIPQMIDTGMAIVNSLLDVFIENLPQIVAAGTEILIRLVTGIIEALPRLIEKAPEIIRALVNALIQNAPALLNASLELITTIGRGLVNNFPKLTEKGRELVNTIKQSIMNRVSDAANWGRDLIQNFINGITSKWYALRDSVANIAQTVRNFIGFSEPKEGPLSNFHTYAPDMMQLFARGVRDNEKLITDQISSSFDFGDRISETPVSSSFGELTSIVSILEMMLDRMNFAIVLDDGTLVGKLAPKTDSALGDVDIMRRRGLSLQM